MKLFLLTTILISILTPVKSSIALSKTCQIITVTDGDSVRVSCHSSALRLACIDAPELDQPYGEIAKEYLENLLLGKEVEIITRGNGGFDRIATVLYVDNVNIQERLLSLGMAWYYPKYASKCSDLPRLKRIEEQAKISRIGLWENEGAIAPWRWRRGLDEKVNRIIIFNRLNLLPGS